MRFPREKGRRHELLLERALCGLSHEAEGELSVLGSGTTDDPDDYEIAAAAAFLALSEDLDPLPAALRQRVEMDALETLRTK